MPVTLQDLSQNEGTTVIRDTEDPELIQIIEHLKNLF